LIGREGALYSFWTNTKGPWKTWQLGSKTDEVSYFPYLAAGSRAGELAGTWFSGEDGTLQAHLALIQIDGGDAPPRVIQPAPFHPDSWSSTIADLTHPVSRSTAGKYLATIFLRGGGLGVVSPLYSVQEKRAGFSWWRAEVR
jgi:hypothetical protein